MEPSQPTTELLFQLAIVSASVAASLFFVIAIVRTVPDTTLPLLGAWAQFFVALSGALLLLREWGSRDES
jgi:hypothetical protein